MREASVESVKSLVVGILTVEHRTVESLLDSLYLFATLANQGQESPEDFRAILTVFVQAMRHFDKIHHQKEENILFAEMIRQGVSPEQGPLRVMLEDHSCCRRMVGELYDLAFSPGSLSAQQLRQLLVCSHEYSVYLKSHIQKEDKVLYVLAQEWISDDGWQRVHDECTRLQSALEQDSVLREFYVAYRILREKFPAASGPGPRLSC